ncbi:MAG: NAD(P)-dependent glycerol-3-phosphate dehydrogenase [Proteobacteria bacterium]|nr:NAD(P)-dependent glycerol-3-phosphate dehydrogenase [Pseudomonadota bacterium]
MAKQPEHFLVLGAGSFGTALAIYLAKQLHHVVLWSHHADEVEKMQSARLNAHYLPGFSFPPTLSVKASLDEAFDEVGEKAKILIVVPSYAFADVILQIKPYLGPKMGLLWATKGLTQDGQFLHTVCQKHCAHVPLGILSGPSFAKEVAMGLPTAVSIATDTPSFGEQLLQAFHSDTFRIYLSQDLIGVQLGGVVKNVLAIAVGMSDGLGFGANARAALITRGFAELCRLGKVLGAQLPTLMGLSGMGDIVLTCTDNQSRNRRFGLALGEGRNIIEAEKAIGQVVEGKTNAKQVLALARKMGIEMPICEQVNAVLHENVTPAQAVANLMSRSPKSETFN